MLSVGCALSCRGSVTASLPMSFRCRRTMRTARHGSVDGEVAEWLKAHAWNACVRETVPWVRIPLSPPASNVLILNDKYRFQDAQNPVNGGGCERWFFSICQTADYAPANGPPSGCFLCLPFWRYGFLADRPRFRPMGRGAKVRNRCMPLRIDRVISECQEQIAAVPNRAGCRYG